MARLQSPLNALPRRLFVLGFPSFYGGAGTELHHQILVWLQMGIEIHLIPSWPAFSEPLYKEMIDRGVKVHNPHDFELLEPGDPILGFCNAEFLEALPELRERTRRTVFVNCMTYLFDKERDCMEQGLIAMFLYQNDEVKKISMPKLKELNDDPEIRFATFQPHFEESAFPFISRRDEESFGCGRISRKDADKFATNTLAIYDRFVSPKPKKGIFLGFNARCEEKIGTPFEWMRCATDQSEISQQEFYRHCDIILQPSDTTENWPRVGFEAMASGSILIVNNRGGWQQMVEHGKTGWLCDGDSDFIYYASKMAYEPEVRMKMAEAARQRGQELGGMAASIASWRTIFAQIEQLPK
jgi:glycosyltransferase involved in cell wall biosynthesis